jgi:hypothetical protein
MNIYQIVSPFTETIYGDSFKEAVKNYLKLNRNLNINHMILSDMNQRVRANFKYFNQDGRNKVGINMYPVDMYGSPIINVVRSGKEEKYIPQNIMPVQPVAMPVMPVVSTTFKTPGSAVSVTQNNLTPLPLPLTPIVIPNLQSMVKQVVSDMTNTPITPATTQTASDQKVIAISPFFPQIVSSAAINMPRFMS